MTWVFDHDKYDHKAYAAAARLEWAMLGRCPLQAGCSAAKHPCLFAPGGGHWAAAHACGPRWVEHYGIRKRKGGEAS
jgi:hypothetical protein